MIADWTAKKEQIFSIRISPTFRNLQSAIVHPQSSKEIIFSGFA